MFPAEPATSEAKLLKPSLLLKSPCEPILPSYRPNPPGGMEAGPHSQPIIRSRAAQIQLVFLLKVYSTLSAQLLLAVIVFALVVFDVWPIASSFDFYADRLGLSVFVFITSLVIVPFVALGLLRYYSNLHPLNLFLLQIFTSSINFGIGLISITSLAKAIFIYLSLTMTVMGSLSLYTLFVAKRGHNFNLLNTFLFAISLITVLFAFMQILFPLGKTSAMIYSPIAAIIFCGYIFISIDSLINRSQLDDFVPVAASLYFSIICLRNCWNENDHRQANLIAAFSCISHAYYSVL